MRPINADIVKKVIEEFAYGIITKDGVELGMTLEEALSIIDECPTIESEETNG